MQGRQVEGGDQLVGRIPASLDPDFALDQLPFLVGHPEHLYGRLIPDAAERHRFLTEICPRDWHQLQDAGNDPVLATTALQAKFPSHAELIGGGSIGYAVRRRLVTV